ncbi:sporulation protein YunB [Christensenellaceae bacterium NSJ-44]|uniref:Sporulation protein YunB n=1 Tax=Luoshenia tenuis TaxID=2763654 RepID=A0A926D1A5_9FIRM|nr:sporulation protein YunB [Luoshenia tenuis]MBC8529621.1 sporulation protein YunB [Luoshenia tenuis]
MRARRIKRKTAAVLTALALALGGAGLGFELGLKPLVISISAAQARSQAAQIINDSIRDVLGNTFPYEALITIEKDENGRVTAVQTDTAKLNNLASRTALDIQDKLQAQQDQEIMIPIGSVFGGAMFAGRGPAFPVYVMPVGWVNTEYITSFEPAGINQTKLEISLKVTAQIRVVVPVGGETVSIDTVNPVAQTIIVGTVPESYVNVDETDQMLNLIPDVGGGS